MASSYTYVPYRETGYFSQLVTGYLDGHKDIQQFYTFSPDKAGLTKAIEERCKYPVNRQLLVTALTRQYVSLSHTPLTEKNLRSLSDENTFTVCTAHQPNLLTGYLYFVYKILHAIKLAEELNEEYPGKHFVPVYYMGSEDNDIEELGAFRYRGDKYTWDGDGQKGAVGRMSTKGLKKMLNELFRMFGPPGKNCDDLVALLTNAYLQHNTIAEATQYLVHELFGKYGLLVLNPDDAELKAAFVPVVNDELLNGTSNRIVSVATEQLAQTYKVQAHPREINLFYLDSNLRERIEQHGDKWTVLNTDKVWNEQELSAELQQHPERFSPNVILRGLFQETILPDVAFIGGGAEVAYWLQLKELFEHYKVFYPCIFLRQSVMWTGNKESELRKKMGISVANVFKPADELVKQYVTKNSSDDLQTSVEKKALEQVFETLKKKATAVDPTLEKAAGAALAKMEHQLTILEQKMLRAEKRKMQMEVSRIEELKKSLFPGNSLQERVENFAAFYMEYGSAFFDMIKNGIRPMESNFLVIE